MTLINLLCVTINGECILASCLLSCSKRLEMNSATELCYMSMNISFFLWYQCNYCSKLHSHLFMPITLQGKKILMFVGKTHLYIRWAYEQRAYIWNNIFISKWMDSCLRGLKSGGGALTWDFTVSLHVKPQVNLVPRASTSRHSKNSLAPKREKMILGTKLPSSVTRTKII